MKSIEFYQNFKKLYNVNAINLPILIIGFSGLIPFILPNLNNIFFFINQMYLINFSFSYGSLILSFLSGAQWGILVCNIKKKSVKVWFFFLPLIPFFLALLLFIFKQTIIFLFIIIGFIIAQLIDEMLFTHNLFGKSYLYLRRILSALVVSNLFYCYINI